MPPLEIISGIPDAHRRAAAAIYFEAFRRKMLLLVRDPARGAAFVDTAIHPRRGLLALEGGVCVGLAGLDYAGESFIAPRPEECVRVLGPVRGRLGCMAFRAIAGGHVGQDLRVECLAVAPDRRGGGVGTALLAAVYDLARREGFHAVRLEVVDTNPRARALYEREGFRCVAVERYPLLRPLCGFGSAAVMRRKLESG
jgi:ribosomal protein S18 acetylase RimI-like enzyme